MAVGNAFKADIQTDSDDLADAPSLFSISKNDDKSCCQMLVDMHQQKIIVKLPEEDFYRYKNLSANPLLHPLLNSPIIVPALIHVLDSLQLDEDREEICESTWYKSLVKILLEKFNCDIEDDAFKEQNSIELAQKLVGNSLSRLWWIGRLTHAETRKDPWELTRLVCETSNHITHILERNTSSNPSILRPFLGAIIEARNAGLPIDTNIVGDLAKYLNTLGGAYILDCLPERQIHDKIMAKATEICKPKALRRRFPKEKRGAREGNA